MYIPIVYYVINYPTENILRNIKFVNMYVMLHLTRVTSGNAIKLIRVS